MPAGFYLKDVRYAGESLLRLPLRYSASSTAILEIVLTRGAGTVHGMVANKLGDAMEGVTAVLVPADRSRQDLYRTAATDRGGRFAFPNIPPGDYKVFSWESIAPNAYLDPEFVGAFDTQGRAIRIPPSSSVDVGVTIIP
jgi:hypothetical protein